jgi:hypothetical protein
VIGTEVTNASGVATQPFTFTLPGNYTIVANVSNSDTTQYGIASTSTQTYVLDQSTLTLNTAQNPNGSATVTARPARRRRLPARLSLRLPVNDRATPPAVLWSVSGLPPATRGRGLAAAAARARARAPPPRLPCMPRAHLPIRMKLVVACADGRPGRRVPAHGRACSQQVHGTPLH